MSSNEKEETKPCRLALRRARRVLVKCGTSVVANENGSPSLTRLSAIVEQISELHEQGVEVIFVSSGAVGMGRRLLRKQHRLRMTFQEMHKSALGEEHVDDHGHDHHLLQENSGGLHSSQSFANILSFTELPHTLEQKKTYYDSACAAAGQLEMMNLYCDLFSQCDVSASQILVTQGDFTDTGRLNNLQYTVKRLLAAGIVPIINENDAVSANKGYTSDNVFSDNDSLATLCARTFAAEICILLTDVAGVYNLPPSDSNAKLLPFYHTQLFDAAVIGDKSAQGRGGMASKIEAATNAVRPGSKCGACIIVSGNDLNSIRSVFLGGNNNKITNGNASSAGTLFVTPGSALEKQALIDYKDEEKKKSNNSSNVGGSKTVADNEAREKATLARNEARKLQALPYEVRQNILNAVADALMDRSEELLAANKIDLEAAEKNNTDASLKKRLGLTIAKIKTLSSGLRQLSNDTDPLDVVKSKREISDSGDFVLTQITVPIGVLLIIFESRPDYMPQISALSLASGNGLLLKGGKEAINSNKAIHNVIGDAIEAGSRGRISRNIIALIENRSQVACLLSLDDVIDLVIPRGSNALVSHIKSNTRIPVLGHADGVCHVYVDESASADNAVKIVNHSKTDYPSACNAMETLLLHRTTVNNGVASAILMSLRSSGVICYGGPNAMKMGLCDREAVKLKNEYGDLSCTVEVVDTLTDAVDWIHKYGSRHTETIICDNDSPAGEEFLKRIDSACVFKNSSTRFADGFRSGLDAEVGISTGRIHSLGPVGVEGLLTTKWQVRSNEPQFVAEYAGDNPAKKYTHIEL